MRNAIKYLCFAAALLVLVPQSRAQVPNVEFTSAAFPGRSQEVSLVKKQLKSGYRLFEKLEKTQAGSYEQVLLLLSGPYQFNPDNELLNYRLGVSALKSGNSAKALPYLRKAASIEAEHNALLNFYSGVAEHEQSFFDDAIRNFDIHLNSFAGHNAMADSLARKKLEESRSGKILSENPLPTKSEILGGGINSAANETWPVIAPDGSWLAFNRPEPDSLKNTFRNRIYHVESVDSGWGNLQLLPLSNLFGTEFHILSVAQDGKKILLKARDRSGNFDLYESSWMIREWSSPTLLASTVNTVYDEIFACYAQNDSMLCLVSNRPEGYGGYDIWLSWKDRYGNWERPLNAGSIVNTPYHEKSISVSSDGKTVFVASEGHTSIGGTDIFRLRNDNGKWTKPANLGYPINSTCNEEYFLPLPGNMKGLMVKPDVNGSAGNGIYMIYLPPRPKEPGLVTEDIYLSNQKLVSEDKHLRADE